MNRKRLRMRCTDFLVAAAISFLFAPADAFAQSVRREFPVTDGGVFAMVLSGNTLYIGGGFTYAGPANGTGVPIDATTGVPASGFPRIRQNCDARLEVESSISAIRCTHRPGEGQG